MLNFKYKTTLHTWGIEPSQHTVNNSPCGVFIHVILGGAPIKDMVESEPQISVFPLQHVSVPDSLTVIKVTGGVFWLWVENENVFIQDMDDAVWVGLGLPIIHWTKSDHNPYIAVVCTALVIGMLAAGYFKLPLSTSGRSP